MCQQWRFWGFFPFRDRKKIIAVIFKEAEKQSYLQAIIMGLAKDLEYHVQNGIKTKHNNKY